MQNENNRRDIKLPVKDLRVGMFVSGLDRDWLDTPFLMQGFFIRSVENINEVAKHCNFVYILGPNALEIDEFIDLSTSELIGRMPVAYEIKSGVGPEHTAIKTIAREARIYVKRMLKQVRFGEAIDTQSARKLVARSVDSVIRHPDAQLLISKLRGQDDYTIEHSLNVCALAIVFGRRLGLKRNQLVNLGLCGLLHDVGKIKIPLEILNKPGRLTDEEYHIMKTHAKLGGEFLQQKKGMYQDAIDVATRHHERPDGKGYPNGLMGDDLSMFTKIISVVDVYDAITGDRVYAKGRPSTEALRIIYEQRGEQFDHKFALAFIQTIGVYPAGSVVELVNGSVALVVDTYSGYKHLPIMLLVRDSKKQPCDERFIDLSDSVDKPFDNGFLIKTVITDNCYGISMKEYYDSGVFEGAPASVIP